MSMVDIMAVRIGEEAQFELIAFGEGPVAHSEPYALLVVEACEGSEPMPAIVGDRRVIRLACEDNEILWRDSDGGRNWRVETEGYRLDPESGELFARESNFDVRMGDLLYVVERNPVHGEPRRRLLGRVRSVTVCA